VLAAAGEDEGPLPRLRDLEVKGDVLWLNGRALADERWLDRVQKRPAALVAGQRVLAIAHPAGRTADVLANPHLWESRRDPRAWVSRTRSRGAVRRRDLGPPAAQSPRAAASRAELAVRAAHGAELAPRTNPALAPART
jgi:hypothetical protein